MRAWVFNNASYLDTMLFIGGGGVLLLLIAGNSLILKTIFITLLALIGLLFLIFNLHVHMFGMKCFYLLRRHCLRTGDKITFVRFSRERPHRSVEHGFIKAIPSPFSVIAATTIEEYEVRINHINYVCAARGH